MADNEDKNEEKNENSEDSLENFRLFKDVGSKSVEEEAARKRAKEELEKE